MTEKELLAQLNNLKKIKPDQGWKNSNREILMSQINYNDNIKVSWFNVLNNLMPRQLARQVSQPVFAVILIMVLVFGGGIVSINAARDTMPGDSLYVAKVISEKARVAVTFDQKEKAKLNIQFAGNRAREISLVLAEENGHEEKQIKVDKLVKNFKKEIDIVKTRLGKISEDEGVQFFGANLGKSDVRLEISEPEESGELDGNTAEENGLNEPSIDQEAIETAETEKLATTSDEITILEKEQDGDITKVLKEAEELFDNKDYNGTFDKLTEASSIIDQVAEQDSEKEDAVLETDVASTTDNTIEAGEVRGINEQVESSNEILETEEEIDIEDDKAQESNVDADE